MPSKHFDFFSVAEAAEYLRVTTGRIRQLLMRGQLSGHKVGERGWAIPRAELDRRRRERRQANAN